jgi:cytoskeletal protein CcmA (bactofilin family)
MFHSKTPEDAPAATTPYGPPPAGKAPAAPAAPAQVPTDRVVEHQQALARPAAQVASRGAKLVVNQGISFSGQVESCEELVVEGTAEVALDGARALEVAESGTFYGSIAVKEATIAGRFEGDLSVEGLLRVTATGAITGSVAYGKLEVEAGAHIAGRIGPLSAAGQQAETAPRKSQRPQQVKAAPAPANAPHQAESVTDESQLFAASVAVGA